MSIRAFLEKLNEDELKIIKEDLSPNLEISSFTKDFFETDNRAFLFENALFDYRVLTNSLGSVDRLCKSLNLGKLDDLISLFDKVLSHYPDNFDEIFLNLSKYLEKLELKEEKTLFLSKNLDLNSLPFLTNNINDGYALKKPSYITSGVICTKGVDDLANYGLYRCQIISENKLLINFKNSDSFEHYQQFMARGLNTQVYIAVGVDPSVLLSSSFRLPKNIDELKFASLLTEVKKIKLDGFDLPSAEVILKGYLSKESATEGGFLNHTGSYTKPVELPIFHLEEIFLRENAIIPSIVVGKPPSESTFIGMVWEKIQLSFLKKIFPEIKNVHYLPELMFHNSPVITVDSSTNIKELSHKLFDMLWFEKSKLLIFTDSEIKEKDLLWYLINHDFKSSFINKKGQIVINLLKREL